MADADVDGAHIRTLLLTFFFRHMKALIEEGYVYLAQPPLYMVKADRDTHYFYTEREWDQFRSQNGNKKLDDPQRFKGLGEMDANQLWETTMDPESRTLLRVDVEDAVAADRLFSVIMGSQGIRDAYETGRGSIRMRGVATIEETSRGGQRIVVTEVPYQVNPAALLEKVAILRKDRKVPEIANDTGNRLAIRNESNKQGMRLVIELRHGANPHVALNNLYKHTQLQDSFGVIMLSLVDGVQPRVLALATMVKEYIRHQEDVVTRR